MRALIGALLARTAGKQGYQRHFDILLDIALRGLNYRSGDFRTSGELSVIGFIAGRVKDARRPIVVFDIGANVGEYALELSRAFDRERTRILCFEPSMATFAELQRRTVGVANIATYQLGFSRETGKKRLFSDRDHSGLASVYQRGLSDVGIGLNNAEEITVATVDDFCRDHKIDQVEFMNIDVEGHELDVLRGAHRMISEGHINFIQFEFGEADIDSRHYLRDFYDILPGYHLHRVVKDGLVALQEYRQEYEIFRTINFLAERRQRSKHLA